MTKLAVGTASRKQRLSKRDLGSATQMPPEPSETNAHASALQLLFALSKLSNRLDVPLGEFFQQAVALIPKYWPRAENIFGRIIFESGEYESGQAGKLAIKHSADIVIADISLGSVEISLVTDNPSDETLQFSSLEKQLLETVTAKISKFAYRHRVDHALDTVCRHQFSILESIDEPVYVADPKTYRLIYTNEGFKKYWSQGIGQKCHQAIYGSDSPCSFCNNDQIFGENLGKTCVHEAQNAESGRWFRHINRAIPWPDGRMVRYEMAIDVTDRKKAEEALQKANEKLAADGEALNAKNVALREVLNQIEAEKKGAALQIQANVNKIVEPILRTLRDKIGSNGREYVTLLENCLADITSPFVRDLQMRCSSLSPREIEICNMIKEGLSTKDMSSVLNTSQHTVLKQRQRIRRKLGLTGEKTNLAAFLQSN